jgi:hypothetical protein
MNVYKCALINNTFWVIFADEHDQGLERLTRHFRKTQPQRNLHGPSLHGSFIHDIIISYFVRHDLVKGLGAWGFGGEFLLMYF